MPEEIPKVLRQFLIERSGEKRTLPPWNLPGGAQVIPIVTGRHTEGRLLICEQVSPPRYGVPLHKNREDEYFYILAGTQRFEVGGVLNDLGPGSHVFAPQGVPHRFLNVGDGPVRMLILCQPAGLEFAFDELAKLLGPPDLKTFSEIARKYGVEVLGPPLTPP